MMNNCQKSHKHSHKHDQKENKHFAILLKCKLSQEAFQLPLLIFCTAVSPAQRDLINSIFTQFNSVCINFIRGSLCDSSWLETEVNLFETQSANFNSKPLNFLETQLIL